MASTGDQQIGSQITHVICFVLSLTAGYSIALPFRCIGARDNGFNLSSLWLLPGEVRSEKERFSTCWQRCRWVYAPLSKRERPVKKLMSIWNRRPETFKIVFQNRYQSDMGANVAQGTGPSRIRANRPEVENAHVQKIQVADRRTDAVARKG